MSVLCACQSSLAAAPDVPPPPTKSGAETWSTITFVKASRCTGLWSESIPARIAFDESQTSRVGVPLGGRVTEVVVERGQHVASGAALFVVASADLAELRSQRDKARIELATARTNLDRIRALVEAASMPAKDLVAANQDLIESRLALQTAEQKLSSLHVGAHGDTGFVVTAPRAGVVVDSHLSVGQQVSADIGPVLTIADVSNVWVYADVIDEATHGLAIGTQARVKLDNDAVVEGTVDQISAVVDPDRHTVPVRVRLDNTSGTLRPGAYAEIQFLGSAAASICVPSTAVLSDGARHYIYLRQAGTIRRRDVVISHPNAGSTAIRAGLALDDEVVAKNGALLDNQLSSDD